MYQNLCDEVGVVMIFVAFFDMSAYGISLVGFHKRSVGHMYASFAIFRLCLLFGIGIGIWMHYTYSSPFKTQLFKMVYTIIGFIALPFAAMLA